MTTTLTKTRFRSGLQCAKKLWFESNKTVQPSLPGPSDQLTFERSWAVEQRALQEFDDCLLIGTVNLELACEETLQAMKTGRSHIAQAAFVNEDLVVRIDLLQRVSHELWNIIEIKMSGEVKKEHIPDIAFQKYVADLQGVKIVGCFIMHLNKACIFPDLTNLFTLTDVSAEVAEYMSKLGDEIAAFREVMASGNEPAIRIGTRCSRPQSCHFKSHCWKDVPFHSIFSVPYLTKSPKKIDTLMDQGIIEAALIPDDLDLTPNQRRYVDMIKGGLPSISKSDIARALGELDYPLYFLDFEADQPPLPEYDGMSPYSFLPFQFSLHVLAREGTLQHHAYLHEQKNDCRRKFAAELIRLVGPEGKVIAYNKSFEKGVLEWLAQSVPEHKAELFSICDRLWDQRDIFKNHYLHPSFGGSSSLKAILEIIVPHLSYDRMEVGDGKNAVAVWVKMLECTEDVERQSHRNALLEYCHLDSLAMVEIHRHLMILTKS